LSKITGDEKNSRRSKSQITIEKITPQTSAKETKIVLSQLDDDGRVIESQPGISTQIELNSNETCKSELNRKFKPISPIKEQSDKKTELSTVPEADTKDELMSEDDESIDAIWIDKNDIIKETQPSQVNPKNITYDMKSPLARRSRFGSSNSSVMSLTSTENSFNDEPSFKRKRKKIFRDLISREFQQADGGDSPERQSSYGDFSSSSSTTSSTPASCVIECCSQSLIFAPKEKQILGEKRAKRAFSECKPSYKKNEVARLFSPQEKRSTSLNDDRSLLTSDVLRSNNCKVSEVYLKPPSASDNSRLIDDILTKNENERNVTKRRRRKLFHDSFNSVMNALQGDENDESLDEEEIKKSLLSETKGAFRAASQLKTKIQQQKAKICAEPLMEVNEKSEHENSDPKSYGTNLSDKSIPRAQDPAKRNETIKNSNETTTASETSSAEQNRSLIMKTAITNFASDFDANSLQKYLTQKMPEQIQ